MTTRNGLIETTNDYLEKILAQMSGPEGGGFTVDEFLKIYDTNSGVVAKKNADGTLNLSFQVPAGTVNMDQLAIKSTMDFSGDTVNAEGSRKILIYDGSTGAIGDIVPWPVHLLKGRSVGWGINKHQDAVVAPAGWTYNDGGKGIYGIGSYIKLSYEGSGEGVQFKKYTRFKKVGVPEWIKADTTYTDHLYTGSVAYPPSFSNSWAVCKTQGYPSGFIIQSVIEFVTKPPLDFKIYVEEYSHAQYNNLDPNQRNTQYTASNVGEDF